MRRFALVALLSTVVLGVGGVSWLFTHQDSPLFKPMKQYRLLSELTFVTPVEVDRIVSQSLGQSFWDVKLDVIQAELTRLDWVRAAQVKRHWPDQLSVSIEEQQPVARWGDSALMNQAGDVFYPNALNGFEDLVLLEGALSDSAMILMQLEAFQAVLHEIGLTITALEQQLDGVWRIRLLDGSRIILDAKEAMHKLALFVAAYPQLSDGLRKSPQRYDLRYSNGFIVGKMFF